MRADGNAMREIGEGMGLGGDEMRAVRLEMGAGGIGPRQNRIDGIFRINGIGGDPAGLKWGAPGDISSVLRVRRRNEKTGATFERHRIWKGSTLSI